MEELRRKAYRRKLFNEQAEKLISRAPALKDEVAWRVDHLNAKWELVEQIMAPIDRPVSSQQDISAGNEGSRSSCLIYLTSPTINVRAINLLRQISNVK